ncbi:hypothetical protein BBJ28_00018517 [Nothophytophthora sp. Chile5]|nr:hypothetical protein BBJ28_00018517 [Nothophytophthora sp. Chile5]
MSTPNWQISTVVMAMVEPAAASDADAELTPPTAVLAIAAIPVIATVTLATLFDVAATTAPVVVVLSLVMTPSISFCWRCSFFTASLSLPELELSTSIAEQVQDEKESSDEYVHCSESDIVELDRNVETVEARSSRAAMTSLVKNDSIATPSYTDDEMPLSPPYTQAPLVQAGKEQMDTQVEPSVNVLSQVKTSEDDEPEALTDDSDPVVEPVVVVPDPDVVVVVEVDPVVPVVPVVVLPVVELVAVVAVGAVVVVVVACKCRTDVVVPVSAVDVAEPDDVVVVVDGAVVVVVDGAVVVVDEALPLVPLGVAVVVDGVLVVVDGVVVAVLDDTPALPDESVLPFGVVEEVPVDPAVVEEPDDVSAPLPEAPLPLDVDTTFVMGSVSVDVVSDCTYTGHVVVAITSQMEAKGEAKRDARAAAAGQQVERPSRGVGSADSASAGGGASSRNNVIVKVGMVGDAQVGKTSLMVKYVEGKFDEDYIHTLGTPRIPPRSRHGRLIWLRLLNDRSLYILVDYLKA